jgi:hypothetical protein
MSTGTWGWSDGVGVREIFRRQTTINRFVEELDLFIELDLSQHFHACKRVTVFEMGSVAGKYSDVVTGWAKDNQREIG